VLCRLSANSLGLSLGLLFFCLDLLLVESQQPNLPAPAFERTNAAFAASTHLNIIAVNGINEVVNQLKYFFFMRSTMQRNSYSDP
jgi:hypothetical protein